MGAHLLAAVLEAFCKDKLLYETNYTTQAPESQDFSLHFYQIRAKKFCVLSNKQIHFTHRIFSPSGMLPQSICAEIYGDPANKTVKFIESSKHLCRLLYSPTTGGHPPAKNENMQQKLKKVLDSIAAAWYYVFRNVSCLDEFYAPVAQVDRATAF